MLYYETVLRNAALCLCATRVLSLMRLCSSDVMVGATGHQQEMNKNARCCNTPLHSTIVSTTITSLCDGSMHDVLLGAAATNTTLLYKLAISSEANCQSTVVLPPMQLHT